MKKTYVQYNHKIFTWSNENVVFYRCSNQTLTSKSWWLSNSPSRTSCSMYCWLWRGLRKYIQVKRRAVARERFLDRGRGGQKI